MGEKGLVRGRRVHADAPRPGRVHQLVAVRDDLGYSQQPAAVRGAEAERSLREATEDEVPAAVTLGRGPEEADTTAAEHGALSGSEVEETGARNILGAESVGG